MLKQRILTALILIPLFVWLVLKLSIVAFFVLTTVIIMAGAFEWSGFMGMTNLKLRFIYPILILVLAIGSLILPIQTVLFAATFWWLIALLLILFYPKGKDQWGKGKVWRGLMGVFVLVPCWLAINVLHSAEDNGPYLVLFLFVLIWGADIAAFFVGKKWGKHKLAPVVSPGKSWEGCMGALFITTLIAVGALMALRVPMGDWIKFLVLVWITLIFSIIGDLFESILKRNVGLKDSGQLLPGHGGLLDRIDSLTAAAPIFALGALWLGNGF